MDLAVEPMDVDRSASSTSKMDISFNDTDSEIYVLDDDDAVKTFDIIKVKKEPPELSQYDNFGKSSISANHQHSNVPETKPTSYCEFFDAQQEAASTMDDTKVKPKSTIKTYHIKMEHLKQKEAASIYKYLLPGILVLGLSIVIYQLMNFKCAEEIDLRTLRGIFSEKLIGQSAAANKMIESLNMEDRSKVIFLYGGTGVGKTFATSMVLENLWTYANVYHYTMPAFADTFSTELMLGLTICKTSILVVDDLTRNDMHITSQIQAVIAKSEKLGKNTTIILVYNCDNITDKFKKKCDTSFQVELEKTFKHIKAEKYFVKFETLKQEHLIKCIENELGDRKVSRQEMYNILKNFDVSLDGCKGVYTKIKFLNVI